MKTILSTDPGDIVIHIEGEKIVKIEFAKIKTSQIYDDKSKKFYDIIYSFLFGKLERVPITCFDMPGKTHFAKKVYNYLYMTEKGTVISYKELAQKVGNEKAYRVVGNLMKNNPLPIIIPCHRVIKSNGELGNFTPGIEWKEYLLNLEKYSIRR
ncbi:MAG: MGMT family protein [Defluviitoga tunisiensis]|jgi:methylated-DNA-[protein]-cysteine S-methyltransferase|uniref:Methylated-DNA--protein-cysteine methyltransferase n=1 Tax=Defluviitoga tunisiensis TaxID=1006576 RepID=A0A0C7NL31_DEFTU|nr:MGMT family protein [Defluviitoga tunisiensis]MDD3600921.1 MGMT family protein [Defluviitoga tunisiensis]MDY0379031.1 MGMT family protein [Defluviitoga tunisiensis]CEP78601.1 O6-alkylguanine-DNA alkyltransferase [Defluviitoga tunisiensis]HHV01480.1 MGMT family protein [Defluviitoga tunisiensis]HOB55021.1 MGMT family protein [Defluviitoga tunisiensis]